MTMDQLLYTILWDDGQTITLYYENFVGLGQFQTLSEFQTAIRASASGAKLTLGPNGGFRGFEMTVQRDGVNLTRRSRNQEPTVIFGENCKHRLFSNSQQTRMNKAWNWGARKNVAHNAQHLVGKGLSARYGSRDGAVYRLFVEPFLQSPPETVQLARRPQIRKTI